MEGVRFSSQRVFCSSLILSIVFLNGERGALAMDKERFISEYVKASVAYENRMANITCKAQKKDELRKSVINIVFSRADGYEKADSKSQSTQGGQKIDLEEVYCIGDGTLFQLFKYPGKEQFALKSKGQSMQDLSIYDQQYGDYLHAPLGGRRGSIYQRIQRDSDTLKDVSDPDPKTGHVKIKLEFGKGDVKENIVAELDPSNSWAVVNYKRQTEINNSRMNRIFEVKYGPKVDGFAMPTSVEYEHRTEYLNPKMDDRVEHKATMEFTDWRFEKRPVSEFQLTHYQLPDIPLKPQARTNWRFYGGLAAIILLLLLVGLYFRSIARRKDSFSNN